MLIFILLCVSNRAFAQEGVLRPARTVPQKVVDSLQEDKQFRYANDSSYWQKKRVKNEFDIFKSIESIASSEFFRLVTYAALFFLFLFVVYRVLFVLGVFERKPQQGKKTIDEKELASTDPADIARLIKESVALRNFRLAIRYQYLYTLKLLSDKQLIRLHPQLTNRDYINQLSDLHDASAFRYLTQVYEHTWYGEVALNEEQYSKVDDRFTNFKNGMSK